MNITEPDLSTVIPWATFLTYEFDDQENRECAEEYYLRARKFLESHRFSRGIKESYIGMYYCKILGIFLFRIDAEKEYSEWIWTFVGDIPSAILPIRAGSNAAMALDAYLGEMLDWVEAVDEGRSVEDLLPVNVPPTKEWADNLRRRLDFIGNKILLAEYRDQLGYDPDEVEEENEK